MLIDSQIFISLLSSQSLMSKKILSANVMQTYFSKIHGPVLDISTLRFFRRTHFTKFNRTLLYDLPFQEKLFRNSVNKFQIITIPLHQTLNKCLF